jgi:hypothetical protein
MMPSISTSLWLSAAGVLVAGTVIIGTTLDWMNRDVRSRGTYSFPDLQNTTSTERAKTILTTWSRTEVDSDVRKVIHLDLVFPFFYALLAALVCLRAATNAGTSWVVTVGVLMAAVAVLAGVFDVLENLVMLRMVGHAERAAEIHTVAVFKNLKMTCVSLPFLYTLLAHFDAR